MKQIIFGFIAALVLVMLAYFTTALICGMCSSVSFLYTFMVLLAMEAIVFTAGLCMARLTLN